MRIPEERFLAPRLVGGKRGIGSGPLRPYTYHRHDWDAGGTYVDDGGAWLLPHLFYL